MMIYMKYVDAKGNVTYVGHNVWDRDRFVAARKEEYQKLGGSSAQVTKEVYRDNVWRKHESD